MEFPAVNKIRGVAFGKRGVAEQSFGVGALVDEIKSHDRKNARFPVGHAPSLHDSFVGQKFEVASDDATTEKCEAPPTSVLIEVAAALALLPPSRA